jgi:hypothetical protein
MKVIFLFRIISLIVPAMVLLTVGSIVCAQDIVGGAARRDLGGGEGGSATRPVRRATSVRVRPVSVTRSKVVAPNTGAVAVSAEPGAVLLIEPVNMPGVEAEEAAVPADGRIFIFNDLQPGRYRVAAELEGYQPAETEVVVKRNNISSLSLNLRPESYNVTINTNVLGGEVLYALVTPQTDTGGQIKYKVEGDSHLALVKNGRAVLTGLRRGTYGLDIRPADAGYEMLLATITLPGPTDITATLAKLESTLPFSALWTNLEDWESPKSWRVISRKLFINGPGIAVPLNDSYRYYRDFQISSDVKMLNEVAASFVIRVIDQKNHYLIQITGAKADQPHVLRGFIIKNGVSRRLDAPIPIDRFAETLKADQWFNVLLKMTNNKISVSVNDSQTGRRIPLGILTDSESTFRMGGVGLAARDAEQNEIGRFIICVPECEN